MDKQKTVYLSGAAWLTQYDCDVFNTIAGMFKGDEEKIVVTADQKYEAMHSGERPTLDESTRIVTSVRKMANIRQSIPELLVAGMGTYLLHVNVVMASQGLGVAIHKPDIERIGFGEITYYGGKTEPFLWG